MSIEWMRHCDVYRDIPESDVDFIAFDDDQIIGRVMQFEFGPENGVWFWSMVVTRPGQSGETNGRVKSRGEAGRCVVAAYKRLLRLDVDDNPLPGHRVENRHGTQPPHGSEE
jgi:hypothetical protein